ncbi:MAG: hypothetical protein ACLFPH_03220 [Bacteroidales bacterium]
MINFTVYRVVIVFSVYMCSVQCAVSQDDPAGARSAGLSHAGVMFSDFWSVSSNQAGLAYLDNLSLGVSYDRGLLPVMSNKFAGVAIPALRGTFGVSSSYSGYSKFYEMKSGLAYAMMLSEKLATGIQVDYLKTHIAGNYDNMDMLTFEMGMLYKVNPALFIGFHLFNPLNFQFSEKSMEVPAIFKLGGGYRITSDFLLCAEIRKETYHKPNITMAFEYLILEQFFIRTGVAAKPFTQSFGLGYSWDPFILDISFSRHNILGYTSAISLNYKF